MQEKASWLRTSAVAVLVATTLSVARSAAEDFELCGKASGAVAISDLPKEPYIVEPLKVVLSSIVKTQYFDDEDAISAADRSFDYRYVSAAQKLLADLSAYNTAREGLRQS